MFVNYLDYDVAAHAFGPRDRRAFQALRRVDKISVQAKLLRVLQEGAFRRVGGTRELKVDVRIVAATNRVPTEAIARKQLREDLYYRLNVFPIRVPALRERPEDMPLLVERFIDEFNREDAIVQAVTPDAQRALAEYSWPGNVRQLRNVIQRAVVASGTGMIEREHLPPEILPALSRPSAPSATGPFPELPLMSLGEMERLLVARAMKETDQNIVRAAAILGITKRTLYHKRSKYGLK